MRRQDIDEIFPGKRESMLSRLKTYNRIIIALLLLPEILLVATLAASLERTPLTGRFVILSTASYITPLALLIAQLTRLPCPNRWRFIMLSPAEEEGIAAELAGAGWEQSIIEILTSDSPDGKTPPKIIPRGDWRYRWVEDNMRRLEKSIIDSHDLHHYQEMFEQETLEREGKREPSILPPPPDYPLLPRPRVSQALHSLPLNEDHTPPGHDHHMTHHQAPHTLLGPPYSLLIVENPDRNAFSYGFGAGGSGGVVLYTGFLDEVLSLGAPPLSPPTPQSSSFFSLSFLFGSRPSPPPNPNSRTSFSDQYRIPTDEQTAALATLLAHELSHLALSHHLETLSSGKIVTPIVSSILVDFARVLLFPSES